MSLPEDPAMLYSFINMKLRGVLDWCHVVSLTADLDYAIFAKAQLGSGKIVRDRFKGSKKFFTHIDHLRD